MLVDEHNLLFDLCEQQRCKTCRHWSHPSPGIQYGDCYKATLTDEDAMFSARYERRHYAVAELWTQAEHGCTGWESRPSCFGGRG